MGDTSEGSPFSEETITPVVNAHGALITMATKPILGQKLGIANLSSSEELACHVVHLGTSNNGKTEVAVEFINPAPFFWRISFPPLDWAPVPPRDSRPQSFAGFCAIHPSCAVLNCVSLCLQTL
jgi:hypothetical protein